MDSPKGRKYLSADALFRLVRDGFASISMIALTSRGFL